jgi:hypothetical protein
LWNKLAGEWRLPDPERFTRTAQLVDIAAEVDRILKGSIRGRVVVRNAGD